jgi:glycosyltransferase involved in cell wall biosynthesis
MRIGYLTYGLDRSPTGIGRYTKELLLSMKAVSSQNEIVVLATERQLDKSLTEGLETHYVTGCRTLPVLMTLGNGILGRLAKRHDLDLIHDPNGIAPFIGLPGNVPGIVTLHDAFPFVHPESHNWLDNWRYRWYLPSALRKTSQVITVSESSRSDLETHLGLDSDRISVIPEGVDPRFSPTSAPNGHEVLKKYGVTSPYLLYVGALNGRKNIARMLEAFSIAREQHPDYTLVIAGKKQWKTKSIDEAMSNRDLQRTVHFTGYVDDDDLPELYRSATAFLFPSLYEGFGLPPLEAMACGTPVITSDISSLPEVMGNAALMVDPLDVLSLSNAIKRVLSDPVLRQSMIGRGLTRANDFRWENSAEQTMSLYERVLALRNVHEPELSSQAGEETANAD